MSTTRNQWLGILAQRRWRILCIIAAVCAGAGLELVPPLVMKRIIDAHLVPGISDGLWLLAVVYLTAVAGLPALGFLTSYLVAVTAQGALHDLRVRLYAHLQRLPLAYHDTHPLGDTISRCTADVDTIDALFSSGVAGLVTDMVRLVTVSVAMVILSLRLSIVAMLVVPLLALMTHSFRKRIRDAERQSRVAVGMMNTHLQETLGGVEVIRAFGREAVFVARFRMVLRKTLQAFNQGARYSSLYSPMMQSLMAAVIALLLWSGTRGTWAAANVGFLGTLTAFVLLFERFFEPITSLGEEWQTVQSALSGAERIFQVLDLPEEEYSPSTARKSIRVTAGLDVHQVHFGYSRGHHVLRHVSLSVLPGEHVALVGRTGAGKTSLLNLLGGLYAPWEGSVRVAGLDPRFLDEAERCRTVGVVPQHVQLFSGTVLHNLTLGDTSVPFKAVQAAAQIAGADPFIQTLPNGYDTPLSNGQGPGVQLSSGQRQLLSLARALVWNPSVLLFDEATSAIDSASEAAFRHALLMETQTRQHAILTVAHRLSTAREADRVLVLESGYIVEQGMPEALIKQNSRFAALLELEAAGWDWQADTPNSTGSQCGFSQAAIPVDITTIP